MANEVNDEDNVSAVWHYQIEQRGQLLIDNRYYKTIISYLSLALMVVSLLSVFIFVVYVITPTDYYLKGDGDHISITPLRITNGVASNNNEVANWTAGIIRQTITLNFTTYKEELAAQQGNWQLAGLRSLIDALKKEGVITALEKRKNTLATSAEPARVTAGPKKIDGKPTWMVEVPLVFSFESTSVGTGKRLVAKAVVVFDPNNAGNDTGLMIKQALIGRE